MKIVKKILGIIFPNHCLYCEKIISAEGLFCNCCWQKLQFITEPKCSVCCHPFEFLPANNNLICASCLKTLPHYDRAISVFFYNQLIKKIIGNLKYRDAIFVAKKLGKFLFNHARQEIIAADFIIVVPLHKKKLRQRKFNQSLLLCHAMLPKIFKTKLIPDFLLRIKNTEAQVKLRSKQRRQNLKSAFVLNPKYLKAVKNKKILLIDDVITTGATLNNCAKILKKHGAKQVTIFTIAKTVFR